MRFKFMLNAHLMFKVKLWRKNDLRFITEYYSKRREQSDGLSSSQRREQSDGLSSGQRREQSDGLSSGQRREQSDGLSSGQTALTEVLSLSMVLKLLLKRMFRAKCPISESSDKLAFAV